VVNVVDLMRLETPSEHPHGMSDAEFDALLTTDKPVIFAYHGYPWLIHRLTYRRHGHDTLHVRGYKEEGTTTTPFDMALGGEFLGEVTEIGITYVTLSMSDGASTCLIRRCSPLRWACSHRHSRAQ
jgi:phosphoketolase